MCGCIHRQQSIKMNGLTSLSGGCTQCVLSDENKNNVNITLACLFLSILVSWKNVSTQLLLKIFEFWIIICQLHWGDVRKAQEKRQSSNFMLDQASHEVGGLQIDIGDLCLTRRWPTWSSSLLSRYMGPFSVILWVLELSHFCPNMPLGVVKTGKKENLLFHQKWAWNSKFCEPNFQEEFRLKWWRKELFFALWGRVEWAGAELNGIDTWACHIWHPWTLSF